MAQTFRFELPDGKIHTYDQGISFREIANDFQRDYASPIMAVRLNNQIHDLMSSPTEDGKLSFIDLTIEDGVRIYARSLSLVLVKAAADVMPNCRVRLEHSLSKGIYGEVDRYNNLPFTEKELQLITKRMQEIITTDEPILKETVSVDQAKEIFLQQGHTDKYELMQYKKGKEIHLYKLEDYYDYFFGYMLPSTGCLKQFDLKYYLPGFILRFPTTHSIQAVPEYIEQPKLARIYYEFEKWGQIMEVGDLSSLNKQISDGRGRELIRIAEALHEKKIAEFADKIASDIDRVRLICIAGPSSSGKTTFAQRLAVQLRVNGLKPISISIDDYFVDRQHTPIGPDGLPDYECLEAIDTKLFNEQLSSLIHGLPVTLPLYNFQKGAREWSEHPIQIAKDQPIIVEGIHGLNERLTEGIPKDNKFKIYVSALTQLNMDAHNRVPTTDNRIIRRIVRDNQFRGHDATRTINLWPMVRRGEDAYIFPYQEEADLMFNSALIYEMAILKKYAEPLLEKITPDVPEYSEAKRLLKFLSYFVTLDEQEVPWNSILREFIGCSCFAR